MKHYQSYCLFIYRVDFEPLSYSGFLMNGLLHCSYLQNEVFISFTSVCFQPHQWAVIFPNASLILKYVLYCLGYSNNTTFLSPRNLHLFNLLFSFSLIFLMHSLKGLFTLVKWGSKYYNLSIYPYIYYKNYSNQTLRRREFYTSLKKAYLRNWYWFWCFDGFKKWERNITLIF